MLKLSIAVTPLSCPKTQRFKTAFYLSLARKRSRKIAADHALAKGAGQPEFQEIVGVIALTGRRSRCFVQAVRKFHGLS